MVRTIRQRELSTVTLTEFPDVRPVPRYLRKIFLLYLKALTLESWRLCVVFWVCDDSKASEHDLSDMKLLSGP